MPSTHSFLVFSEATAKRLSELTAGVKSLVVTADLEKSPVDRLTMFFDYLKVICTKKYKPYIF